jgi:hypothetical protein
MEGEAKYYQGTWFSNPQIAEEVDLKPWQLMHPDQVVGRGNICNTRGCQAGWLVALTPVIVLPKPKNGIRIDWNEAGAAAGGLDEDLAAEMFETYFGADCTNSEVAAFLRSLADLPESDRNLDYVRANLSQQWYALNPADDPDNDGECNCEECRDEDY